MRFPSSGQGNIIMLLIVSLELIALFVVKDPNIIEWELQLMDHSVHVGLAGIAN